MAATAELNNGYEMPLLGLGTWQYGVAGALDPKDEEFVKDCVRTAIEDVGYRHVDTAYLYGTERPVGQALKDLFERGVVRREDIFVTTKLPQIGMSAHLVEHFMRKSLEQLGLDYVDMYLMHFPVGFKYQDDTTLYPMTPSGGLDFDFDTDIAAVWKAMEAQVDAGRTKSIGLSNLNQKQIERILQAATIRPACLQTEVHVFVQDEGLRNFCESEGILVTAYGPLASPGAASTEQLMAFGVNARGMNVLSIPELTTVGEKHGKTNAQIALKFLLQLGVAVIPKSSNPKRMRENFEIFDFELDEDDLDKIKKLDRGEDGRILSPFHRILGFNAHPECPF